MSETVEMFSTDEGKDKNVWYDSYDLDFIEMCKAVFANGQWMSFQRVLTSTSYADAPIKPINLYAANISTPPELVSIVGNEVRLRQLTYADIYVLENPYWLPDKENYNVDRPWIRQYYQTRDAFDSKTACYSETYSFYMPWFIDQQSELRYENSEGSDAFEIKPKTDFWFSPGRDSEHVSPHMVSFKFRKNSSYMEESGFGVIRRGTPMFDVVIQVSDIMIERIKEFYAKD